MNRLCSSTLNTSFCLISDEFETKLVQTSLPSVNKPAKDFLKRKFDEWYSQQVIEQLDGENMDDFENVNLQPIDLSLPALKEVGAKWLVEMAEYISSNPQMIVNGFIRSGISGALDRAEDEESWLLGGTESEVGSSGAGNDSDSEPDLDDEDVPEEMEGDYN